MNAKQSETGRGFEKMIQDEGAEIRKEYLNRAIDLTTLAAATPLEVERAASGILSEHEGLKAKVRHELQAETEQAHDRHDSELLSDEMEDINREEGDALEQKQHAEAKLRRLTSNYDWSLQWWWIFLDSLLFIGDTVANGFSLTVGGGSLLMGIAAALAISIAIFLIALSLGGRLRDTEPDKRLAAALRYLAWMLPAFTMLAALRSFYVFGHGRILFSSEAVAGTLIFAVVNLVIFMGGVIVSMCLPSREDRVTKKTLDDCKRRVMAAEKTLGECKQRKGVAVKNAAETKRQRIDIAGEQAYLEEMISKMCESTLAAFHHEIAVRNRRTAKDSNVLYLNNHKNQIK